VILRRRFGDVVERQLQIFQEENDELIAACDRAEIAYDRAPRDEAEARYGEYTDLVESGTEILAELRDSYSATLAEDAVDEYRQTVDRGVLKRLPRFALEIEEL